MDHEKKLKFIHQMTKMGLDSIPLQHYDLGGDVHASGNPATTLGGPGAAAGATGGVPNPNTGIVGTIGGALGLENNYQAGAASIQAGTNAAQLNQAYDQAQQGINNQGAFVGQVQPGVGQGVAAQGALGQQLMNEANGVGPNPAQAALNQSTGQNIEQQAALMAGQRGAAANPGMIAEQAARQGGAIQQQAVGQAATLQAQQQIAAQQQLQGLAAQQVGQGAGAIGAQNQAVQNEQGVLQGANTAQNNAAVSQQSNINTVNAGVAHGNQAMAGNIIGGVVSGAASAISHLFAEGGEVKKMAAGGYMAPTPLVVASPNGPQSFVGQYLNNSAPQGGGIAQSGAEPAYADPAGFSEQAGQLGAALGNIRGSNATGEYAGSYGEGNDGMGSSDVGGSGQDAYGNNSGIEMRAAKGGVAAKKMLPPMNGKNAMLKSKGGPVKAGSEKERAVKDSDSYANDKIPALLSQGEVVMDLDTLHDPGPIGKMARTVAQHIAVRNSKKGAKHV